MTQPAEDVASDCDHSVPGMDHGGPGDPARTPGNPGLPPGPPASSPEPEPIDFAVLVPRYESSLLRYVGQLLGPADNDLEDIVQDAFLRLHKHLGEHGVGAVQNVSTWLFRVAHNLTMDTLRKRKVRRRVQDELLDGARAQEPHPGRVGPGSKPHSSKADPGDEVKPPLMPFIPTAEHPDTLGDMERREACDRAMKELEHLAEPQRQAVMLKMIEGMTIRQIAEVTQTSIGNVGYRISQGLAELTRRLKQAGVI